MNQDTAITVDGLSKAFRIGLEEQRAETLAGSVFNMVKAPLKNFKNLRSLDTSKGGEGADTLWALRDVSFEVKKGEVLGIIGRNGAGKSTLLKVLSRITEPTKGEIRMRGRVSSLLEVGTGFHPELTGRENIYMNGTILGMRKFEIDRKFDEIVEFSGVERFLDTPVKRYSSGQKVRLAFSVAAHLEPEILIVDEVLAVGDAEFQRKCIGRMKDVTRGGDRTILFVSHNMTAIAGLCDTCIILDRGTIGFSGCADEAVDHYLSINSNAEYLGPIESKHILAVSLNCKGRNTSIRCGDELEIHITPRTEACGSFNEIGIVFLDDSDSRVAAFHSSYNSRVRFFKEPEETVVCRIGAIPFVPGRYSLEINVGESGRVLEKLSAVAAVDVGFSDIYGTGKLPSRGQGMLCLPAEWHRKQTL